MSLEVLDTQVSTKGMKVVGVRRHPLVPLLTHNGPFCVLVIIVSHRVIPFLDEIYAIGPSGICLKHSRLVCSVFLPINTPPILDMGDCLKERKCDLFLVGKIVDKEIPS